MKTTKIETGTLEARSACDYDCIFKIRVISRTEKTAKIIDTFGNEKRVKIYKTSDYEYIRPENYSMAPIFTSKKMK